LANKGFVPELKQRGVGIRVDDATEGAESSASFLTSIDIVISAVDARSELDQFALVDAAKLARIKWYPPCTFTTVCPSCGVMEQL